MNTAPPPPLTDRNVDLDPEHPLAIPRRGRTAIGALLARHHRVVDVAIATTALLAMIASILVIAARPAAAYLPETQVAWEDPEFTSIAGSPDGGVWAQIDRYNLDEHTKGPTPGTFAMGGAR